MKKISIIGAGLIGGSLGLALRKKAGGKYFVTGVGRNTLKLKAAKKMGAVDAFSTDIKDGVKDADIIVICTPVHLTAGLVKKILPFIKPGAVITDAGSVKGSVIKEVEKVFTAYRLPLTAVFIGAHPMAGSERSGIGAARAGLYEGAAVAVIKNSNSKASGAVIKMWRDAGGRIIEMSPEAHDRAVALVSHLPHVLAFGMSGLAGALSKAIPALSSLAAGSFKDITRVADSNPADWASICGANKKEVSKSIDKLVAGLKAVKTKLNDPAALEIIFERSRLARQKLLNTKSES